MIAVDGEDRDPSVGEFDDRRVEGAATEVVDQHGLVRSGARQSVGESAEPVGEGGGDRFGEHPGDVDPGVGAGLDRGAALLVAEVGGHGDHRALHLLPGEGGVGDQ